jgi:hypothetical protein
MIPLLLYDIGMIGSEFLFLSILDPYFCYSMHATAVEAHDTRSARTPAMDATDVNVCATLAHIRCVQ